MTNNLEPEIHFTAKEIAKTIKLMTRGKSPGHDGLSIEHLQHAGPHLSRLLAMLFNFCVRHSYVPEELMRTVVVPIVKNKTGDISSKTNYRPISLATVIAKVFDGMLNEHLKAKVTLHDNQFGFRPKLSTEGAILSMKHAIRYYTDRNTPVYACFLDLSKAFDLVSYPVLWGKLRGAQVAPEVVHILQYWYGNQINSVKWSGALSDPYRLGCGVRQGGISSPTLFNLYVNELIGALSGRHVGCHIDDICFNNISYADDMVLLSASVGGLRELINICETHVNRLGLKYNVDKSKIMVFKSRSDCPTEIPPIKLRGEPLEQVQCFKYLGHIVTPDMKDDTDIERERRALSVRANMIARRFARCSKEVKITLFRAYCTSFYTSCLWLSYTQKSYSALRVQYNNALRTLLRLPRFCSASGMFAAASMDCFYATMRKRAAGMAGRARDSRNSLLAVASRMDGPFATHWRELHTPPKQLWTR
ncbi:hypothetical protein O0L34_g5075 [Tuta absoluta]|nr:hypothetical protein O0L34_g5075 [Tuta absoluta]